MSSAAVPRIGLVALLVPSTGQMEALEMLRGPLASMMSGRVVNLGLPLSILCLGLKGDATLEVAALWTDSRGADEARAASGLLTEATAYRLLLTPAKASAGRQNRPLAARMYPGERVALEKLLAEGRCVALAGPPGSGKTALALQVAQEA